MNATVTRGDAVRVFGRSLSTSFIFYLFFFFFPSSFPIFDTTPIRALVEGSPYNLSVHPVPTNADHAGDGGDGGDGRVCQVGMHPIQYARAGRPSLLQVQRR